VRAFTAVLAGALALALGGCSTPAPPAPLVVGASGDTLVRLAFLADQLTTAATPLCRDSIGTVDVPQLKDRPAKQRCHVTVELVPREGVGAAADGDSLLVSTGMLGFVRNDDELAVVIAHRMAHLIADTPKAAAQPWLSRGPPREPEPVYDAPRERVADRISLFVLARADIDPAVALACWRRMQGLPRDANDWLVRHPVTPERIEAMAGIVTEIGMLRDARQALLP
jgi:predicted Zn-dependent protease